MYRVCAFSGPVENGMQKREETDSEEVVGELVGESGDIRKAKWTMKLRKKHIFISAVYLEMNQHRITLYNFRVYWWPCFGMMALLLNYPWCRLAMGLLPDT